MKYNIGKNFVSWLGEAGEYNFGQNTFLRSKDQWWCRKPVSGTKRVSEAGFGWPHSDLALGAGFQGQSPPQGLSP